MEELFLEANGLRFHALADGPAGGPLVLLLHGFPELSRSWRHQLAALAGAGYRAVAPDLRGYGQSGLGGPYDAETLAGDVAGLVRALGREKATVVGHDWGGGVAWYAAFLRPEVVERLVVMNCPHPAVLAKALLASPRQALKSWYMFMFQLPWLPERLLARGRARDVARALRGGSRVKTAFPKEELDAYRDAFADPRRAAAALGYYRAAFRRNPFTLRRRAKESPIRAPALVVWGVEDRFLGPELVSAGAMAPYFAAGNAPRVVWIEGAGHFVQNEAPGPVNEALLSWLGPAATMG